MESCPDCGLPLQTLDLPCPVCSTAGDRSEPVALHQYSQTFRTRWAFRPETSRFLYELNSWLYEQPGLVEVKPLLHRNAGGVSGVTLMCVASETEASHVFQFAHVPLMKKSALVGRIDPGVALDDWRERNPETVPVWVNVGGGGASGLPTDCWVLSAVPRAMASEPVEPPARAGFKGVQRLPVALLFPFFLLILLAGVAGGNAPLANILVFAGITAALGWAAFKFPVWRRRRPGERHSSPQ